MNNDRILALAERFWRISFKVKWRSIELFYYPLTSLLLWGLLSTVVSGSNWELVLLLLAINIIWSFSFEAQNNFNIFTMEDVWNDCFREIIVTPITPGEYLVAKLIAASARSLITLTVLMLVAGVLFHFNIASNPPVLAALLLAAFLASMGIAITIDGLIIHFGKEFAFLAWSAMEIFLVLSCPYYSIDVFPAFLHIPIKMMPFYWTFEGLKSYLFGYPALAASLLKALVVGLAYLLLSLPAYRYLLDEARKSGRLAGM